MRGRNNFRKKTVRKRGKEIKRNVVKGRDKMRWESDTT